MITTDGRPSKENELKSIYTNQSRGVVIGGDAGTAHPLTLRYFLLT